MAVELHEAHTETDGVELYTNTSELVRSPDHRAGMVEAACEALARSSPRTRRSPVTPETASASLLLLVLTCVACGPDGISGMGETSADPESLVDDPAQELARALDDLEAIVQGTVDYYVNGVEPEWAEGVVHLCPHPGGVPSGGEAGLTPGMDVDCNAREDGLCVPAAEGEAPGIYDTIFYTMNPVWIGAGFEKTEPHAFRYNLYMFNEDTSAEYASCRFTATAHADLDDDGIFSTYERRGELSEGELLIDPVLYVTEE